MAQAGLPDCGAEHFPRTDPVAIMLAVTRDRCLLGRGPHFGPGMYSALAGFIEPGETIEDAVRRETFEESGIRLGRVAYHASQPWPFPYSLMIGCYGEALNEDIQADLTELEACRWFERVGILQASSIGYKVYQRLGFHDFGKLSVYLWEQARKQPNT